MPLSTSAGGRLRRAGVAALLVATAWGVAPRAGAQVPPAAPTDADRMNAREQFNQGVRAQQEGHWADALLAFERAQALFPAPTNMLHIAECQAQTGRLVEAAETYRGLVHLQLPRDAPQPFVAAQSQGAAELQQIEARIPKMRIEVTPANIPNLSVTVDQQPLNVILLGADRSVDPGPHTVVAFAPGYGQKEAKIVLHEREPGVKVVALALSPQGGVIYVPSTGTVPPPQPLPPGPSGNGIVVVTPEPPPPPPPQTLPPPPPPRPVYYESRLGILAGVRLGYEVMGGGLLPQSTNVNTSNNAPGSVSLAQAFGNQFSLGVQAGVRFQRRLYLGVFYDHGFGGGGSNTTNLANYYSSTGLDSGSNSSTSISAHGNRVALDGAYISNPDGIGIILDVAVAYRELGLSASNKTFTADYTGGEVLFGGGLWIKAGSSLRIIPRLDVALGSLGNQSVSCPGNAAGCDINSGSGGISNSPLHVTLFAGVGGYFNLDFFSRR